MALLEVKDLDIFLKTDEENVHVVKDMTFSLNRGQTLAIVGESGSGKSVTSMAIMQLLPKKIATFGQNSSVVFDGKEILKLSEKQMRSLRGDRIGMIFQEPMTSLNPFVKIGKQVAEAVCIHNPNISQKQARQMALETLETVKIPDAERKMDCYPHEFSGGQLQRIMIAMTIINKPDLLIADEPTTALDVTTQAEILDLLMQLQKDLGMAIILISHDLRLVRRYSHQVCVMQHGVIIERGDTQSVFNQPWHKYTKELLMPIPMNQKPLLGEGVPDIITANKVHVDYVMERSFFGKPTKTFSAVKGISLHLKEGETLGIVGESGSGKSTIGRAIMQIVESTGEISFGGRPIKQMNAKERDVLRRDMQIVFQDPFNSLSPRLTVGEIVGEGLTVHFPQMTKEERRQKVVKMLKEVNLSPIMINRYPHEFSGGQRQRIAIARAIILEPKFVLLDEPTSALDRSTQIMVVELLNDLQRKYGLSYIFISHDLSVVRALSDRVMVMSKGEVIEEGTAEQIFENPQEEYTKILVQASNLS